MSRCARRAWRRRRLRELERHRRMRRETPGVGDCGLRPGRGQTDAKKAAPKTTRNPNVHRTGAVHSECGWERGGVNDVNRIDAGRKPKTFKEQKNLDRR